MTATKHSKSRKAAATSAEKLPAAQHVTPQHAKTWDPNSEQQWMMDKAAGGAAWAQRFIDGIKVGPKYDLQGWISDAEGLFEGKPNELGAFYDTLQAGILQAGEGRAMADVTMSRLALDCHLAGIEDTISKTATILVMAKDYIEGETGDMVKDAMDLMEQQMGMAQRSIRGLKSEAGIKEEEREAA